MPKHYRPPGKKKEGNAAKYITRTKAVHYLQVSLSTFRKLCILKGIFPREPKKKVEGNHKTYYHMKDILFLAHEPLLEKFRDIRAHKKKVKKAMARKNRELADRLLNREPTYKLDRLILERYPTFVDALRDLDDCLTMVHLFAALPAVEGERIQVERIHNCRRLSHEWQAYISRTHSLRKTFISVKGIYYQAEVEGQKITWLTPHALQQVLTDDVDFNVMLTFSEFYVALLGFVNFKLYHSINVKYPPILDPRLEALAAECRNLFRNFKIFLSREVPRESLLFVIPAFGGVVSWEGDGSPFKESDEDITYQIVDRPTQGHVFLSREYIQPQWVYDCINARIILPTEKYLVGRVPPPHLSPFVDNEAEGYIPEYAETIKRLQAAAKKQVLPMPGVESQGLDDPQTLLVEGIIDRTEANEAAEKKRKLTMLEKQYHDELNMELRNHILYVFV
ncbi:unnamed protein product [Musa acuminata var. zebrina]